MIKRALNLKTSNIPLAAFILGAASLSSALLGLIRDRLLAGTFGAGMELDIYYTAFRIPDFVNMTLITGAISAAIIPVFNTYWRKNEEQAKDLIFNLLSFFLLCLLVISFFLFLFAPLLVSFIAPGFEGEKKELTVILTRIMLLSPILLGLSNIMSGILHVFSRFFVTSLAPIMYNLGIIFGITVLVPIMGITGLAWGVAVGGLLHLLVQAPIFFHLGFNLKRKFQLFHRGAKQVIKLMLPRSLGLAAAQFNLIAMTAIGSMLAVGSIAVFNLANHLSRSLILLIAVPFSTAAFPAMAENFSRNNFKGFIEKLSLSMRMVIFLIVPFSALFFVLRAHIVRIIYGTGRFGWADTQLTGACVALFSISLFAYGLVLLLSRAFYAMHNTKTPALTSIATVALNIVLCLLFTFLLRENTSFKLFFQQWLRLEALSDIAIIGLPLAYSISGIFYFLLLAGFLKRKIQGLNLGIFWSFLKTIGAVLPLIVSTYLSLYIFAGFLDTARFWGLFFQAGLSAAIGIVFYLFFSFIFKSSEFFFMKRMLLAKISRINPKKKNFN